MSIPDSSSARNSGDPAKGVEGSLAGIVTGAVDGFTSMAVAAGGGIETVEGAPTWYSPSNIPVFNAAGLFSTDLVRPFTLDAVGAYFQQMAHPYSLMVLDGLVPGAAQRLDDMGYVQVDSMPAMWLDNLDTALQEMSRPADLMVEVKRVESSMERATFRSVLLQVFAMPAEEVEIILTDKAFDMPNIRHYIARADEVTIGTASVVIGGEIAGIWNVGMLAQHRRRGIALQMMYHALTEAHAVGCHSSMLLASRDGTPLYERLGYSTISTLRVFVPSGAGKQQ
ncbi:MAG: GNAT family N-acetyltransferase [Chloroflexia bacterium]